MTALNHHTDVAPARVARWQRVAAMGLAFRPSDDADLALLERIYASTRADELSFIDWSDARKAEFVAMQFRAQHAHYREHYPDAEWLLISHGGAAVGRLYLECWPSQYRIIDIAFLAGHRGKGFGEALLRDILDEASRAGRDVSIHVEKFNPAMRLYRRLGFTTEEDKGVYDLMRWTAGQ